MLTTNNYQYKNSLTITVNHRK